MELYKRGRTTRLDSIMWEEFRTVFMDRFLPASVRDARAYEFEALMQTLNMTILEYEIMFM